MGTIWVSKKIGYVTLSKTINRVGFNKDVISKNKKNNNIDNIAVEIIENLKGTIRLSIVFPCQWHIY